MKALFLMCCNLVEKFGILDDDTVSYSFWEEEVIKSFKNKQFNRWKLASLML